MECSECLASTFVFCMNGNEEASSKFKTVGRNPWCLSEQSDSPLGRSSKMQTDILFFRQNLMKEKVNKSTI